MLWHACIVPSFLLSALFSLAWGTGEYHFLGSPRPLLTEPSLSFASTTIALDTNLFDFPKAAQGPPGKSKVCGCSHYPGCCCTIYNIPAPDYNLTVSFPSYSSGSLLKDCIPSPSLSRTSELSLLNGKPLLQTQFPGRRFQADGPYQKSELSPLLLYLSVRKCWSL